MRNPYAFVKYWAEINPDGIAVTDERMSLTYQDLKNFISAAASLMAEKGVKRGDLVCLTLPSLYGFVFQILLHSMGVTVVSKYDLNPFHRALKPDFLLTNKQNPNFDLTKTILINQEFFNTVSHSPFTTSLVGFEDTDQLSNLFGTSGTTGETKFLEISAENFGLRISEPAGEDLFGDGLMLMLLPFGSLWASQHAFRRLTYGKPYITLYGNDALVLQLFNKFEIETIIGSPAQISHVLDLASNAQTSIPHIKYVILGGDSPSPELLTRIRATLRGCRIFNNYGSTEVGGIAHEEVTSLVTNELLIRPFVDVEVVDFHGNLLPDDSEGLIRTKSKHMGLRFHNDPASTSSSFKEGFHYSGDIGKMSPNGKLILSGRADNVLHLGGLKISAELLEAEVGKCPGIAKCVAFEGFDSESGLKRLALAVVTGPSFKSSKVVELLDEVGLTDVNVYLDPKFPIGPTGKVLRHALASELAAVSPSLRVVTNQGDSD